MSRGNPRVVHSDEALKAAPIGVSPLRLVPPKRSRKLCSTCMGMPWRIEAERCPECGRARIEEPSVGLEPFDTRNA